MPEEQSSEFRDSQIKRFAFRFGIAATILALIPALVGFLSSSFDRPYLGMQYNTDDHMVYAAWMRQAMDGDLLFNNRFTTDAQPGLTLHVYFLVLGWVAKVIGIVPAMTVARAVFSFLFVIVLGALLRRSNISIFAAKAAITLSVIAGGIGFAVWQNFGVVLNAGANKMAKSVALGRLPTDVWQPEGFTFPSMLTNSLFMVSLCLILWIWISVVDSEHSWKPVLGGGIGFLLLMNIHSYDVLLCAMVLVGALAALLGHGGVTFGWIARIVVMGLCTLPAVAWFSYVLQNDPVFQARAVTPTYSPNFRQVVAGYAPLLLLSLAYFCTFGKGNSVEGEPRKRNIGIIVAAGVLFCIGFGWILAKQHLDGYWMSLQVWILMFAVVCTLLMGYGLASRNLRRSDSVLFVVVAWALIGLIAPYFPALFERKLMMGLSIPWAILAALGFEKLSASLDRGTRNLAAALCLVILSGSSLRWLFREIDLIKTNVSNTTVHRVYLSRDTQDILRYLESADDPKRVVIAMPGIPMQGDKPDTYLSPIIPDLNPIVSGLTGAYTYAGHWSETPLYSERRNAVMHDVYFMTDPAIRAAFYRQVGANYVIDVSRSAVAGLPIVDLTRDGEVVVDGSNFRLVKLNPSIR